MKESIKFKLRKAEEENIQLQLKLLTLKEQNNKLLKNGEGSCRFGKSCWFRKKCRNKHSKNDQEFWAKNPKPQRLPNKRKNQTRRRKLTYDG